MPSFAFCPGKKDHVFEKKIPSFQIVQERSCAGAAPFGKTIFSEGLKKISYFRVFFKKDHLSFSVQRVRSYFREKEISSFLIIQERSYSSAIFLERPSFQDVRKKNIWFSVQCNKDYPETFLEECVYKQQKRKQQKQKNYIFEELKSDSDSNN